ncbi:MAG: dihydroneopterin aldolase [Anaerolineaceae bacterium]
MDEIFIKDLLIRGVIGITEREREQPQDILVNITVFADSTHAGLTDDLNASVNYRTIAKKTLAYVEQAKRYTVEALAADIMKLVLEESNVLGAKVKVEKPGAVRFSRSVGIEITRMKD